VGQAPEAPSSVPSGIAPLQWENPPQGKSPFGDQQPAQPVQMFEPDPPKTCTREAFDRGLCVVR
jgi:hypothetical protein